MIGVGSKVRLKEGYGEAVYFIFESLGVVPGDIYEVLEIRFTGMPEMEEYKILDIKIGSSFFNSQYFEDVYLFNLKEILS